MKNIILSFSIMFVGVFTLIGTSSAISVFTACNNSNISNHTVCNQSNAIGNTNPVIKAMRIILEVLSMIAGIVAVFGLIIAGIRIATSNGDSNSFNTAKGAILYVVIGVAIVVLSQSIILYVLDKLK